MKKVVITGGTGFIGLWLVREMLVHDIEVIVLVRDLNMTKFESVEKKQTLRLVQYHTEEYEQLKKADTRVDAFYHLAWAGVSSSEKNDGRMQLENVRFSMEMLEYARQIRAKRFMGMGTVAEYAFSENTIEANGNRQTPNDMYGAAKTAAHYMLEAYARILELPFNWVVLPSTFGEGRRDDNIITYTITTLLKGQKPQYGMLTQMWDFLYVKEVVRALRLIGEQGCEGKTYGVGSGVFRQLKDYIIKIRDIIDPNLELGIGEIPSLSDKAFSSCVNIYDLAKDTGFEPQITFEEGIRRTIAYYSALLDK
jgi:nucleoside-diphosphate-sugar epimerase